MTEVLILVFNIVFGSLFGLAVVAMLVGVVYMLVYILQRDSDCCYCCGKLINSTHEDEIYRIV